jgi:membrane protein DedA with SNARE-associated domain
MRGFVVDAIAALGVWGVAALMLLENVFPPIPSELVMPLAGYLSSQDRLPFAGAIIAGTIGSVGGAVFWYVLGRRVGQQRLERWIDRRGVWIGIESRDVRRAAGWFERHGGSAVLIGRLIPGVRSFISLPAGFQRMAWVPFLLYTTIGSALWSGALAFIGRLLGREFDQVGDYIGPVSWIVIGVLLALYLRRVVMRLRRGDT